MAKMIKKSGSRKRFAEGGNTDRYQAKYDRKVADIESDYKKAMARKTGRAAEVAKAKYEQRMADAKDDLAKWRGGDRTETRAAERAAERNLSLTRRVGARAPLNIEKDQPSLDKYIKPVDTSDAVKQPEVRSFKEAFAEARKKMLAGGDKTFTWNGKSYGTQLASEVSRPRQNAPARQRQKPATTSAKTDAAIRSLPWYRGTQSGMVYLSDKVNPKHADFYRAGMTPEEAKRQRLIRSGGGGSDTRRALGTAYSKTNDKSNSVAGDLRRNMPPLPFKKGGKVTATKTAKTGVAKAMPSAKQMGDLNMAKGGKVASKATKAGKAMVRKSADTMGRAMVKKFAKGGSVDGCAIRGKTRAPMRKGK